MSSQKSHVQGLGFSSNHLFSPLELVDRLPRSDKAAETVNNARETIKNILHGDDAR